MIWTEEMKLSTGDQRDNAQYTLFFIRTRNLNLSLGVLNG